MVYPKEALQVILLSPILLKYNVFNFTVVVLYFEEPFTTPISENSLPSYCSINIFIILDFKTPRLSVIWAAKPQIKFHRSCSLYLHYFHDALSESQLFYRAKKVVGLQKEC